MNELAVSQFVARLHAAPVHVVLAITGGGSAAISSLLRVPGGSATVLEAVVPYSPPALSHFLGAKPDHFCSQRTARAMAMAALWRCRELAAKLEADGLAEGRRPIGVGVTASLASHRPKRGPHRLHVATQTEQETVAFSLELTKGARTRAEEEDVAALLVLKALGLAVGVDAELELGLLPGEVVDEIRTLAPREWQALLLGTASTVAVGPVPDLPAAPRAIFSGAFDPLHEGHREMARVAESILGRPVEFEVSIENVDKPPLDYQEMSERADQFAGHAPLWFTRAPTFVRKAQLFPGATFVVGADTMERLAAPRYYAGSREAAAAAIAEIARLGCRFLVFGRQTAGGFEPLDSLALPAELRQLCTGVPESKFRSDISSTAIRRARENPS